MICRNLVGALDVYQVGSRVLYARTGDRSFALFEDELTPEELLAIAGDIARRAKTEPMPTDQDCATRFRKPEV